MRGLASALIAAGILVGCSAPAARVAAGVPAAPARPAAPAAREARPADDRRILHALSRLTYGPRPGDLERMRAVGLQAWIDRQLNPETIDDAVTERRARPTPAPPLRVRAPARRPGG